MTLFKNHVHSALPQEKRDIDGVAYLDKPETMELKVLVRSGHEFRIHPDHQRQWTNVGGDTTAQLLGGSKNNNLLWGL